MIAIIDYDAGNLKSVEKALLHLGERPLVSRDPEAIEKADKVILPGVGAFGEAMERLRQYGLVEAVRRTIEKGTPFLGICLGMQLLFESSEECPGETGLGLLEGEIVKIPDAPGLKIPHMGWNSLDIRPGSRLFHGIEPGAFVYFVHSYYLRARREEEVAATAQYGVTIHGAVEKENLFACQFHPEKSGSVGLQILDNFVRLK